MNRAQLAGAALVVAYALAGASPLRADEASVGPEWDAFGKIAAHFEDATFVLVSQVRQSDGTMASSTLRVVFRKPHFARCEVIQGNGAGGVAVWRGGDKVLVRPPGLLSRFVLALNRDDSHVVDARGRGCGQTTLDNFPADFASGGSISESAGPEIGGVATDVVTWIRTPGSSKGDTKKDLYISKTTHLPVESKVFDGDKLVEEARFKDIRLDTAIPYESFSL